MKKTQVVMMTMVECTHSHSQRTQSERGAVLILVVIVLAAAFGMIALVIDQGREELAAIQLQNAAEAAALASVQDLKGSLVTSAGVKSTAIKVVRNNPIYGLDHPIPNDFALTALGTIDSPDGSAPVADSDRIGFPGYPHLSNVGVSGNLVVRVDRGQYNWSAASGRYEFRSLENATVGDVQQKFRYSPDEAFQAGMIDNAPLFSLANAVRVTLQLREMPTMFGGVFGVAKFEPITRTAVAVVDSKLEECVAPFAIPACSLMLNTDDRFKNPDGEAWQYQMFGYEPKQTCERELVFTEARYENDGRREGMARSDSYARPPCKQDSEDCSELNQYALPIRGVLGLPERSRTQDAYATSAEEIGRFFKEPTMVVGEGAGCPPGMIRARLGDGFKPVERLVNDDGTAVPGFLNDQDVRAKLRAFIQEDPNSIDFFDSEHGFENPGDSHNKRFPYLRSNRPDLSSDKELVERLFSWPSRYAWFTPNENLIVPFPMSIFGPMCSAGQLDNSFGDPYVMANILLEAEERNHWTNPMCHDEGIPANKPSAKIRPITVMVIAPGRGSDAAYCDWANTFQHAAQNSTVPHRETYPYVVGFVKINAFDFNIMRLDSWPNESGGLFPDKRMPLPSSTPRFNWKSATSEWLLKDRSPFGIERTNFPDCGMPTEPESPYVVDPVSEQYDDCIDAGGTEEECSEQFPEPPLPPYCEHDLGEWNCQWMLMNRCFRARRPDPDRPGSSVDESSFNRYRNHMHCLPIKVDNCFPDNNPNCWKILQPLRAQYGCGGVRARVSCDDLRWGPGFASFVPLNSFTSVSGIQRAIPTLVKPTIAGE